uniref:Uncharacterized protein n=1 Tax=Cacopsylla melanoneura TaxID=428564 RepID=A0A8D8VXI8_9HEMI
MAGPLTFIPFWLPSPESPMTTPESFYKNAFGNDQPTLCILFLNIIFISKYLIPAIFLSYLFYCRIPMMLLSLFPMELINFQRILNVPRTKNYVDVESYFITGVDLCCNIFADL